MNSKIIAATLLLLGSSSARGIPSSHRYGHCQEFNVPIKASADNQIFDITQITDNISAEDWALTEDRRTTPPAPLRIEKNITVSGVYNIHAQLCVPHSKKRSEVIQIATHGAHYDSRYWDAKIGNGEHSWIEASMKAGYPVLTYDRLGAGQSDHPDAYQVVQSDLELEILRQITVKTRDGSLHHSLKKAIACPPRVIHVGHSFGSFLTSAFIAKYPELSDAAVITGYVLSKYLGSIGYTTWGVQNPADAEMPFNRSPGYVVCDKTGIQNIFFGGNPKTAYTKELFEYGNSLKQPVPVGELASAYKLVGLPGLNFKGPIHFMLAEFDFFICKGQCDGVTDIPTLKSMYPKSAAIGLDIQPNTGHGFPLHNNATAGFQVSLDFLKSNGF